MGGVVAEEEVGGGGAHFLAAAIGHHDGVGEGVPVGVDVGAGEYEKHYYGDSLVVKVTVPAPVNMAPVKSPPSKTAPES
ncbi:MAG TPA: hypothetical protein VGR06_29460 [Actinophytocola sp.]|nr:hypothetical protein [Actinophytocola sp.]